MKSGIKLFRADARWDGKDFNWPEVKAEVLLQFDAWRETEHPTIFTVKFGKVTGQSLDPAEQSHYWYIEVLYCK